MSRVITVANVAVQSATFVVNSLRLVFFRFAKLRGLPPDYLIGIDKQLREALEIWIGEQSLTGVEIEVYRQNKGIERLFLSVEYCAEPLEKTVEPDLNALENLCEKRPALLPDANYRIIVFLKDEHTVIPGWGPVERHEFEPSFREELSAWGGDSTRVTGVYEASGENMVSTE